MKLSKISNLLVLGLILSVSAVGCKHHPVGVTPLTNKPGTYGNEGDLGKGGKIDGAGLTGNDVTGANANLTGIPSGPGHPGWTQNPEQLKADTVYFEFDSSVVRASEKSKVASVADYLKANGAVAVLVEGHCDERGTEEYNRSLGERRALALRESLVGLGVDSGRVDTISFGKDRPADPGHTATSWGKNRRGAFVVLTAPGSSPQ